MAENVENLIVEHLRAIRADIAKLSDKADMLIQRVGSLERHLATLHDDTTGIQLRLDHHEARLDRIERRLELTAA